MADVYRYPCLDSPVFIAWIKGEVIDGIDRKLIADQVFNLARRGVFRIVISSFVIAEVFKPRHFSPLTDTGSDNILAFFEQDFIDVVDVDRRVAEEAHRLARQYGITAPDAIMIATAIRAKADVILTWDDALIERMARAGWTGPPLERPRLVGQADMDALSG